MKTIRGIVLQFTGLSGAGKTTISIAAKAELEAMGYLVALVDADVYRKTWCSDLGFSKTDRIENIKRLGQHASLLAKDFDFVIIAAINPYKEGRLYLQQNFNAFLIYIENSIETLKDRDPKGLYQKALLPIGHPERIAHFTGISDPFEQPESADLILNTNQLNLKACCYNLVAFVLSISNK